jgi:hypothetical protein
MTDHFVTAADDLIRHAGSVDRVAEDVTLARDAAVHVQMGRGAYGKLPTCQMIPTLLDPIQDLAVDSLREAVDSLQTTAEHLRGTARRYTGTDESAARRFTTGGSGR